MNLFARQRPTPSVIILGAGATAGKIYKEVVEARPLAQCSIKGFVPLEEEDSSIPSSFILRGSETLLQLTAKLKIAEIVVVQEFGVQKRKIQQLLDCKMAGVHLSDVDEFLSRMRVEDAKPAANLESPVLGFRRLHWH